jgi:hypothetical protein
MEMSIYGLLLTRNYYGLILKSELPTAFEKISHVDKNKICRTACGIGLHEGVNFWLYAKLVFLWINNV